MSESGPGSPADEALFPGFRRERIRTGQAEIHAVVGGQGPPVLLLHGYPETHVCWHRVAPALAARFDPNAITGAAPGSAGLFALAAIPARWALERSAWAEAAALEPQATDFPYTEAMTYFARSLGASRTGDLARAKVAIDSLASIQRRLDTAGEPYWAEQVAIQHLGARAWLDLAEHRETEALARMREAATREDATEKSAVTPGPLAPARELLGDMLVELKRPAEAKAEYRAVLRTEPNRRHALRRLGSSPSRE